MSVNSSSSNDSLPPSSLPSSINMYFFLQNCFDSTAVFTISTLIIISLVILPVCILVLYLGLQRWRKQPSGTTMSHSDIFTYNIVFTELTNIIGSTLICCGLYTDLPEMMFVGIYLWSMNMTGQMLFHMLTCVERYLAVVHPIIYLSLKTAKGIRIRNISIGCVWLQCFAWPGVMSVTEQLSGIIIAVFTMSFALIVISFCSLSVLYILIRPGPGEGGGNRQQVDQSKLKAFYTIMAILGVLLFKFGGSILATALSNSPDLQNTESCHVWFSGVWCSLPSSLVLPLLFLQRAGKLVCCKNNNTSGQGSD